MRLWSPRPDPIDPEALVARAAAAAVAEYRATQEQAKADAQAKLAEFEGLLRAQGQGPGFPPGLGYPPGPNYPSMGMPGAPTNNLGGSPYPLYGYDYPYRYSIPQPPSRKPGGQIDVVTLRQLADSYDVLRACVAPDTLVFCKRGLIPISEIQVGEEVLTHRGRWRKVTECLVHPRYEEVYRLESRGLDPLVATGNHPVYAARYRRTQTRSSCLDSIDWRRVDELKPRAGFRPNDAALLPAMQFVGRKMLALAPALGDRFFAFKGELRERSNNWGAFHRLPAKVPFGSELGNLLGWYLAEGAQSNGRTVVFCLGPDERHIGERLLQNLCSLFDLAGRIKETPGGNGFQVIVHSSALAGLFNCGTARTKRLPEWAWNGGREFFAAMLEGWAEGDGCREKRGSLRERRIVRTASKTLAEQMRLVAISLGYAATLQRQVRQRAQLPVIRGQEVHSHPEGFIVQWAPENSPVGHHRFEQDGHLLTHTVQSLKPVPYEDLVYNLEVEEDESYTTTSGIIHNCILHLQREVVNVPIQFVARDEKDKSEKTAAAVKRVTEWFDVPGGLGGIGETRESFEHQLIEDVCVIGAGAIYFSPTRGGGVYEALPIDAGTIRPRADAYGWPGPGEAVYEQWVMGILVRGFTREEIAYRGIYPRSWTPFFSSPIEFLLATLLTAIKVDEWNRVWLTEGNEPGRMYSLPDHYTSTQVYEFAAWFLQYAGDSAARQQLRFLPGGSTQVTNPTRRDNEFQEFTRLLITRTCSCMGVQPASIGYVDGQYAVTQENSMRATSEFGVSALLSLRKVIYDDMLRRLGYPYLKCVNVIAEEEEALERADRNSKLVTSGIKTPNEARADEGLDPIEGGEELYIPTTLQSVENALNPPMPPTAPPGAESGGDVQAQAKRLAIDAWQRKSLVRLKERGEANCPPAGAPELRAALPDDEQEQIRDRLKACRTPDEVRAVFAGVPQYHETAIAHQRAEIARRWRDRRLAAEREA